MGQRRTATVRAKSFANLFILRKTDLYKTLEDYPETREKFRLKAEQMLRRGVAKEEGEAETEDINRSLPKVSHWLEPFTCGNNKM